MLRSACASIPSQLANSRIPKRESTNQPDFQRNFRLVALAVAISALNENLKRA